MARRNQHKVAIVPRQRGTQQETDQAPEIFDPESRQDYVTEFEKWEQAIEAGLWKTGESEDVRAATLAAAEAKLDSIEIGPHPEVVALARELEGKLCELIDALRGNWRGRVVNEARKPPPDMATAEQLSYLLRPVAQEERRVFFCGKMEAVLHAYRDPRVALVKSIGDKQLNRLTKQADGFAKQARELDRHFLLSQVADTTLGADIEAAIAANAGIVAQLSALISSADDTSLRSLLEANGSQLRNQFTFACAVVCLKVYGNVAVSHLRQVSCLKHVDYLTYWDQAFLRSPEGKSDLKRMGRQIDLALSTVQRSVRDRHRPIEPVLALFKFDAVLGRGKERARPQPAGTGMEDHAFPSGDGASDW
ncbi:MAG: hypothetical protein RIQ53_2002 [Pseudomonadota bacterium]|jgi:hypothetical protein